MKAKLILTLVALVLVLAACGQAASPAAATLPALAALPSPLPAPTDTQAPPASPTASTAPAAGASALAGRYYFADDPTRLFDLAPGGSAYWPDNYGTYTVSGNQVTFVDVWDCTKPGVYEWSLDGTTLKLKAVKDPCAMRHNHTFSWLAKQPSVPYVVVKRLTHGQEFSSFAVDKLGNLYATKQSTQTIEKYGPDGTLLATLGGPGTGDGLFVSLGADAADSQGNLYVADLGDARVEKFDASGKYVTSLKLQCVPGPLGVAVDRQDNVYVALNGHQDHYVEKWSADGKQLATWGSNGTGDGQFSAEGPGSGPRGITVDLQGNVYVTDPDNNRVQKFDANGQFLLSLMGNQNRGFAWPFGVSVDGTGHLYVLDGAGQLFEYDAVGTPLGLWLAPWASSARLDAAGSVFMIVAGDPAKIELPKP